MKFRSLLLFIFLSVAANAQAQNTVVKYYKKLPLKREVSESKAVYERRIITEKDGTVITEDRKVRSGKVIGRKQIKGTEPTGIWIISTGNGLRELNYDFDLVYKDDLCGKGVNTDGTDFFKNNDSLKYTAPVIETGEPDLSAFISRRIYYQPDAIDNNIQGTVILNFRLEESGKVLDIVIKRSVHPMLDKEAVRVLKELKMKNPAMENGKPQRYCISIAVKFNLL